MQIASEAPADVYGPNGDNYANNNPQYDFSRIKIDIHESGSGLVTKQLWTVASGR